MSNQAHQVGIISCGTQPDSLRKLFTKEKKASLLQRFYRYME